MKGFENLLALAVPLFWLGLALVFRRLRRNTVGKAERDEFRARLPSWVARLESLSFIVIFAALSICGCVALFRLHSVLHGTSSATGLAMMMIVLAWEFGILPPAMILANLVSWLIPPVRAANERANAGLPTASIANANKGLLVASAVVTPLCLIQGALGVFEPWAH